MNTEQGADRSLLPFIRSIDSEIMINNKKLKQLNYSILITIIIASLCLVWISFKLPDPSTFMIDPNGKQHLAGANQILEGEHPFIYFRSTYGPLVFYTSAVGQILSGKRIIGEIILWLIGYAIAYTLLFRLLWLASGKLSVAILFNILALILIPKIHKYYIVLGPVMSLCAAWNYVEKPSRKSLWLLSLAIAITGLFRPDFGVYSALSGAVVVGLRPAPLSVRIQRLLSFAGAIIACASPWLIWALVNGGLITYFYDSTFGAVNHAVGLSLPIPGFQGDGSLISPENGLFILFRFFYVLPAFSIFVSILKHKYISEEERRKIVATAVLAQGALLQASHRADYEHFLQAIPISFVLCAWLTGLAISQLSGSRWQRRYAVAGLSTFAGIAATFIFITTSLGMLPHPNLSSVLENFRVYSGSYQTFLEYVQKDPANWWYPKAMQYVRSCTSPSQRILALPFIPIFYYLTDRPFGGGQMFLAPGYFSNKSDQIKMVKTMSSEDISVVIDLPGFEYDGREDRKVKSYAPIVFDYLNQNFTQIGRFGPAVVKVRREQVPVVSSNKAIGVPCPR